MWSISVGTGLNCASGPSTATDAAGMGPLETATSACAAAVELLTGAAATTETATVGEETTAGRTATTG